MYTLRPTAPVLRSVAVAALVTAAGCAESFRIPGASPAVTEAHFDQMFEAFSARFAPNEFGPRYNVARVKIAQSALVPSRIFGDTTLWESRPNAATRAIYVSGGLAADGKYRLETRPSLPPATRPGDSRHVIALEKTGDATYRWEPRVDLAVGAVTADDVANALAALLRAPEGRTEREVRADYRAAFPRATASFGKGFSLDSVQVMPAAAGTTGVTLRFGFHPDQMRGSYPQLASYLDKYLGPAKYHVALADRSGVPLFDVVGHDRSVTIRYRLHEGRLASLSGAPRPWPDSVQLTADVALKVKIFTVGFRHLVTDFVISNTGSGNVHERAWTIVAQHEPEWDLPMLTERLIRSPLRRPFEAQGAMFRMAVRDSAGGQTSFSRRTRLDVEESAIMRFIGSLASHAVGDLDDRVELEEHRFMRDGFVALQADLRALGAR